MKYFSNALKKYATFAGRTSRKGYWMFILFYLLFYIVAMVLDFIIVAVTQAPLVIFSTLFALAMILPCWSITVRRLHDTGKSGWMILVGMIPLIGGIWLLVLMCKAGDTTTNAYGEIPLEV